jgi:hypothetical protein
MQVAQFYTVRISRSVYTTFKSQSFTLSRTQLTFLYLDTDSYIASVDQENYRAINTVF